VHFTSLNWNMMEAQPVVQDMKYLPRIQQHFYKPIIDAGLRPDIIDAKEDLSKYKVVFSPLMMTIEEGNLPERITEWVKNGGTWIVGPLSDVRNINGARWRDRGYGILEELTGVQWKFHAPDKEGRIKAQWNDGAEFKGDMWYEMTDDATDDVLVRVTDCHSAMVGTSLLTCKQVGKGKVVMLGTLPSAEDMAKIIGMFCEGAGKAEGEVMAAYREGEAGKGLILVERAAKEAAYTLDKPMVDLLTGETLSGKITLKPYDVKVLKEA